MAATHSRPVVLITGAASGIGAATAETFADRGWTVYATDIDTAFPPAVEAGCRCWACD
ncbi:MAG: SDR family NAD(P)-dependent oxidoreductase, partial [Halohasta sp.]